MAHRKFKLTLLIILILVFGHNTVFSQQLPRVIVLGLDGMRPDGIENAYTPNLHKLIAEGTSTMKGRAVFPTSSGANWSSMLLGSAPDQHGIDNNGWTLDKRKIIPVFQKENGYSPSIFDVLRNKYPEMRTSAVIDWIPIANFFDTKMADTIIEVKSTTEAIDNILEELINRKANFVFSQILHMDETGHAKGYGSEDYYKEAEILDKEIGRLLEKLKESGLYEESYIITLSDHGGSGYGHGNKSMIEYEIPFIIKGPGVKKGKTTREPVQPFDVAATVAAIFDCEIPPYMIGSSVHSAFGKYPDLLSDFVPRAVIQLVSENKDFSKLSATLFNGDFDLKYKIGKGEKKWKAISSDMLLPHGDTLYVATFTEDGPARISTYSKAFYDHLGRSAEIKLENFPSEKYESKGPHSLLDGMLAGSSSFGEKEWLGFSGDDLLATIEFRENKVIQKVKLRFLENVNSWIFLPKSIEILGSLNGKDFEQIVLKDNPFSLNYNSPSISEIEFELNRPNIKYLKVIANNFGLLPEWHSSPGSPAWLFIDEIIIE